MNLFFNQLGKIKGLTTELEKIGNRQLAGVALISPRSGGNFSLRVGIGAKGVNYLSHLRTQRARMCVCECEGFRLKSTSVPTFIPSSFWQTHSESSQIGENVEIWGRHSQKFNFVCPT